MAVSSTELDIIIKAIAQGQGITEINRQLDGLKAGAGESESATGRLSSGVMSLQSALSALGLGITISQLQQFASEARAAAIEQANARNALTATVGSVSAYNAAMNEARQVTNGMVSDTQLAQGVNQLMAAGLAQSATDAAQLIQTQKILQGVFGDTAASFDRFYMLLSGGSPMLYNNFALTKQQVDAQAQLLKATKGLSDEEAKSQAVKDLLIASSKKYSDALGAETVAANQAAAAQTNFLSSFGNVINSLDKATGASSTYTTVLNKLTEGANAWSTILNQQIPAIQNHNAALADQAARSAIAAQSQDQLVNSFKNATSDLDAFKASLAAGTGSIGEYNDLVARGSQGNQILMNSLALTADEYNNLKSAMSDAVVTSGSWVSSLNAMNIYTTQAAAAARDLADAQHAVTAANQQQQKSNADLRAAKEAAPELGARITEARTAAYEEQQARQQEQQRADKAAERQAKTTARAMAKSFDEVGQAISSNIGNAVSGAINDLSEVWNPGGNADPANGAAQWARRMAAIAAGGIKDEWANPERWANFGGDKSILQPLFDSISKGDDAAVKAQAQALLTNKVADLFDANMIAQQAEQKWRAQQLQQQLNDRVSKLLGEKGLQAAVTATQQVQQVATDTGTATQQVGESVTGLGVAAEATGPQIAASFDQATIKINLVNQLIRETIGLTERWGEVTQGAVDKFNSVGPGAATKQNLPTSADKKMGGNVQF